MKPARHLPLKLGLIAAICGIGTVSVLLFSSSPTPVKAQSNTEKKETAPAASAPVVSSSPASTNAPPGANASAPANNVAVAAPSAAGAPPPGAGNAPAQVAAGDGANRPPNAAPPPPSDKPSTNAPAASDQKDAGANPDEIQLSFQGANIDMIVQWLANTTGKSVIKHPQVNCQLTIVSSKKLRARDAINLVYRGLSMEGFTAVETSKSILIVPEGKEPKMNPEILDASKTEIPEGREKIMKIFPLKHVSPAELRDKIKPVLSDKAGVDIDDRSNQLIVTDYNDNIRLLVELIKALDVESASDSTVQIYSLKHSEAEDLVNMMGLILNAQGSGASSSSPAKSSPPGMGPMPGGPGGPPSPSSSGGGQAGGGQVRLWSDKTGNRLIVAAPRSKIPEVENLIALLDTDKPEDVGVRVIQLKNVSAEDLVNELKPLYQRMGSKSLKDNTEITANTRSNALIILSSEANFKAIEKLVTSLDTEDAQEKTMQAFLLKNADAEDVAKQLQQLNQDQDQSSRYFYYYSMMGNNKNSKKMSVVADRRRNTVIVQAPPSSMDGIAKMIKALDEPVGDNNLAPKIYPLKYVSAVDIEDVLNELFLKKNQQRNYFFYDSYPEETPDRNVGRLYGKVRITSEPYSNSIIITSNSPENLSAVEEVLKQLDVPSQAGETTVRVGLKFAQAINLASSMNILFAKGGSPALRGGQPQPGQQQQDNRNQQVRNNQSQSDFELEREVKEDAYFPWLGGQPENNFRGGGSDSRNTSRPVSDLVGRVRVVPDRRTNGLLVTANVHLLPQVLKLINELDAPTAQVLIEARIIEVSTDFRDKLGVRWSADGSKSFTADDLDNSLLAKSSTAYKQIFAGSSGADSLRTGILDTSVNLDLLIQFLRKNTDSTVLAEPQISIADNELGKLFVGAKVPFIAGSLNTDVGGRNDTFEYKDVGIILEVTPHINNTEEVDLKIRAESSNIRDGETLFGGAILDTRNFRTEVMVKTGQTVILGGIIQKELVDTVRKVPLLGDIPGLGWAFKKKDKVTRNVELMVFLRPRVTRTPAEAAELLQDVEKKMPRLIQQNTDTPPAQKK